MGHCVKSASFIVLFEKPIASWYKANSVWHAYEPRIDNVFSLCLQVKLFRGGNESGKGSYIYDY
jgi:hypothetical protein